MAFSPFAILFASAVPTTQRTSLKANLREAQACSLKNEIYKTRRGNLIRTKCVENAEIAKFTPDEKNKYEECLKYYRDLKNVVDTSFDEGKAEGKIEDKVEIARQMKSEGEPIEKIIRFTVLTAEEIENL